MEEGKFCAGQSEKKPTGILKDLLDLNRWSLDKCALDHDYDLNGRFVLWSDVEAIINKYLNP